jgi:hypothetical protein
MEPPGWLRQFAGSPHIKQGSPQMLSLEHATELIRQLGALRLRIDALDAAATGICAGMRLNTLDGEAAFQLLDLIAADLRAKTDTALRLLTSPPVTVVTPRAGVLGQVASPGAGRGSQPMPASSAGAR